MMLFAGRNHKLLKWCPLQPLLLDKGCFKSSSESTLPLYHIKHDIFQCMCAAM